MLAAFAPQADNIQREAFAHTSQGWVCEILLEHADDAEFITLED